MPIGLFLKKHRYLRRALIGLGVAVVLFTVLGFLVVPAVARSVAEGKLSALLHRQVTIESVRINPYALSATVRGIRIRDLDGAHDLFALKEVYVNVQLASLFKGGVVIQQVRVEGPAIHIVRVGEDRYSFSDILDDLAKAPPSPPPPADAPPARFSLSNLELIAGHIELDDRWKATKHTIADLNVSVPFVSNFPYLVETFVQPAFSATINGTRLAIQGVTKPFSDSLESSIEVNLEKVDLPYYLAYVPMKLRLKLTSAILDTRLKVTFVQYQNRAPRVDVAGSVALSALEALDDTDRPLLKLPLLDIAIDSSDLLSNTLALRHIRLQSLAAHVRRGAKGELQFQSLLASDAAPSAASPKAPATKPTTAPAKPWLVTLGEFKVEAARVAFTDTSNPRPFQTTLYPLSISLRNFTTVKGGQARLHLTATTDVGESLRLEGGVGVDPVAFDGTLGIQGIELPRFSPYYASQILFDVRKGTLDLSVPAKLDQKGKTLALTIEGLRTDLRDLQLRRRGDRDDFFRLPEFSVGGTNLDLAKREVVLGDVATSGARIVLARAGATQPWNLETLLPAAPAPARTVAAPESVEPGRKDAPFAVTVRKLDLKDWALRVEDRGPRNPAITTLDRLGLRVEGLSTARGQPGRVNFQARLNQSGSLGLAGTVGLTPLSADLQVKLKTLPIVPFQPYFQGNLAMLLTSGHVGANGRAVLTSGAKGPVVTYKGEFAVGEVVAVAPSGEELARLGELWASGIDVTTTPLKVAIDEIALNDFGAQVVILPNQTLNLASIVPADGKAAAKPAPVADPPAASVETPAIATGNEAPPSPVRVGAIILRRGNFHILDRSITPAFDTSLSDFGGRIAGLSFAEADRATVDLEGKLGNGPMAINGRINPLAKKPFIDLSIKLSDLDLSAMTPYSGKYAGYAVEKGQLYLDLKYVIDARRLDAKNEVRLSQFTFGSSVPSKDATGLPVRLAVSLLKDRHGVIQLDLPVSGSLDDPKFSVWGVVGMVLKNLLIKAATSPFALIGSLFGGGEALEWLEFAPGRAEIPPAARSKVAALAKALFERPGLRLEVEGHADPARDLEALRRLEFERKVNAQKVLETVANGKEAGTAAPVIDAEYARYLTLAYRADEKTVKPKNALGMIKDVPTSEMEQRMLAAIVVTQDDLRLLARKRAQVVRDQILRAQSIQTERVFLMEPKSIPPTYREKVSNSRVDFRLR